MAEETVGSNWKDLLKDKRLLGAAAAGIGGGTLGAFVAPDFIYKKPTWYNRLLLGAGTGVSSAAIVLAAMAAMQKNDSVQKPSWKKGSENIKDAFGELPSSLSGAKYTKQVVNQMTPGGKAVHGIKGGGIGGWFVRNFLKRPFGDSAGMWGKSQERKAAQETGNEIKTDDPSVADHIGAWAKTTGSIALPLFVGHQTLRGLDNYQRAKTLVNIVRDNPGGIGNKGRHLVQLLGERTDKGVLGTAAQALKATAAKPAQLLSNLIGSATKSNPAGRLHAAGRRIGNFAQRQFRFNPFLQTAGVRTSGIFNTTQPSNSLLGFLNRNKAKYGINSDPLTKLLSAKRTDKAFRGSRGNRAVAVLAALATLGAIGGANSLNSSDPYEKMVNYGD